MKAPAFQFYAGDYLADAQVMMMTLEQEGAYIRLLAICWREGSLPSNPALLSPLCKFADVKVIKAALALFVKSPTQPGRLIHKRLEEERAKQEAYRAKQSEKGAKGGRPRKADEKPEESHGKATALPQLNRSLTVVKPEESSSISSSTSTDVDEREEPASAASPEPVTKPPTPIRPPLDEDEPLLAYAESFFSTDKWPAVVADVRKMPDYATVNFDHYRDEIRLTDAATPQKLPNRFWRKKLMNWLKNDLTANSLVKVALSMQPKGKSDNEPDYRLNNEAVARRRREKQEAEQRQLEENRLRVVASDAKYAAMKGQHLAAPIQ